MHWWITLWITIRFIQFRTWDWWYKLKFACAILLIANKCVFCIKYISKGQVNYLCLLVYLKGHFASSGRCAWIQIYLNRKHQHKLNPQRLFSLFMCSIAEVSIPCPLPFRFKYIWWSTCYTIYAIYAILPHHIKPYWIKQLDFYPG